MICLEENNPSESGSGEKRPQGLKPIPDKSRGATYPLSIVEIDHTKLDLSCSSMMHNRLPVGRPWVTLAMDVYSRMVTGFYISLRSSGRSFSTGLCVAHSMMKKDEWLVQHGIDGDWPCWGRMDCIHVDNAKEFQRRHA